MLVQTQDDGSGSVIDNDLQQLTPLRLGSPVAKRRFCCDVLTVGNSVSAQLRARHVEKPDLRQVLALDISSLNNARLSGSESIDVNVHLQLEPSFMTSLCLVV